MASKRTFAQGREGGWYVVGSERRVGNRVVRDYVSADVAMRAMSGKITDKEIDDHIQANQANETKRDKPNVRDNAPAIGTKGHPAGRQDDTRDSRLPKAGTKMWSKDKRVYVKENAKTGVFTVYNTDNQPVAVGNTITAALSQYAAKPVAPFDFLNVKKDSQMKRDKSNSGRWAAKFRANISTMIRNDSIRSISSKKGKWLTVVLESKSGEKFAVKMNTRSRGNAVEMWAKSEKSDSKPFRVDEKWVESLKYAKIADKAETVQKSMSTLTPEDTILAALSVGETHAKSASYDVYSDGIALRSYLGKIEGFLPADFSDPVSAITKAMSVLACELPENVNVNFTPAPRVAVTTSSTWEADADNPDVCRAQSTPELSLLDGPKAFCYSASGGCFVGAATTTELCKAMGVVVGAKSTNATIREGYPRKTSQYADRESLLYPIDTEEHVRAALSYFGNPANRTKYSHEAQVKMAQRMVAAAKRFDINVSEDSEVGKLAKVD